jgi:hypothetical protein
VRAACSNSLSNLALEQVAQVSREPGQACKPRPWAIISFWISVVPPKIHTSWQVDGRLVLGNGVGCSPFPVGSSTISSNTLAVRSGRRLVGLWQAPGGKGQVRGYQRLSRAAYELAAEEERHARSLLEETSPAGKATMTVSEFCERRFLPYHARSASTC